MHERIHHLGILLSYENGFKKVKKIPILKVHIEEFAMSIVLMNVKYG